MPLKFTNSKAFLKILWTNEDKSRTATFVIHKELPEPEQVQELLKAVGFLGVQAGIVPVTPVPTASVPAPGAEQGIAKTAVTSESSGPVTGPQVPTMPPVSLSDRPADGGPPSNRDFWESMPTMTVPPHLAGDAMGGWEMIPPEEM